MSLSKKPILVIDPGHGGKDPGGGSNQYWLEKDMVLDISLYQYERFQELGVPVEITRTEDVTLESSERTQIVRDSRAAFCLSNHINAGGGQGWEIIHSIYDEGNLAKEIGREFEKLDIPKRRIFTRKYPGRPNIDYYYMHRETGEVKTNIIEYGFADNPEDTKYLLEHWKVMGEAVVKAFCNFIGHPYSPPNEQIDRDAAQKVIDVLGALYMASANQKVQEAAHYAADALREAANIE